jgi:hypothetical protein
MELIAVGAMMHMAELTASHLVSALAGLDLPLTLPFFCLLISPY